MLDPYSFDGLCAHLHPSSFKMLRRIGLTLCQRLRQRYIELAGGPPAELAKDPCAAVGNGATPLTPSDLAFARILACFKRFSDRELEELCWRLRRFDAPRGQRLFGEGESAGACYFVLRGAVELCLERKGKPLRLAILGPGRAVGHAGLLDDEPRGSSAIVREEASLLVLPRPAVEDLFKRRTMLALKLLEVFNEALVAAIRRTDTRQAHDATIFASG